MRNQLKYLLLAVLLGYIYFPTFAWMVDRWMVRDSYFTHGFLIPVVSLYWVFKKRKILASLEQKLETAGLPIFPVGILIQLVSYALRIYFLSAISFVIVLFGAVYFLFGKKVTQAVWFPIVFLFLMVPLPLLVISEITLKMKFFVSEISTFMLNSIGLKTMREGSYIYTPHAVCLVGDPCSGLRSFLAFLCLGFVFAYGMHLELWKKLVLIVVGLPLAIVSNVFRVFTMALLGEIYGMEFAGSKPVHDGAGILTFVFALACFLLIRRKLEEIHVKI